MSRARKQTSSAMPSVALDEAMAEEARAQTHLAACREALEGASVDDAEHLSVAVVRAEAALRVAIRTREACAAVARAAREAELRDELARCLAAASERDLLHESADIARHIHDIEHEAAQRVLALRSDWGAMVAAQNEALARAMTIAEELGEPPPKHVQ